MGKKILKIAGISIIIFIASFTMVFLGVKFTGGIGNRFINPSSNIESISWSETLDQLHTIFGYTFVFWGVAMYLYFYIKNYFGKK